MGPSVYRSSRAGSLSEPGKQRRDQQGGKQVCHLDHLYFEQAERDRKDGLAADGGQLGCLGFREARMGEQGDQRQAALPSGSRSPR